MSTSLDDLISAVQSAVIKAQQLAEDHHIDLVGRFFDLDEASGQYRAKTQKIWVPSMHPGDPTDKYVEISVPLISLANLGSIRIKELTVEFDAKLGSLETTDADGDGVPDVIDTTPPAPGTGAAKPAPVVPAQAPAGGGGKPPGPGPRRPGGPGPGFLGGLFRGPGGKPPATKSLSFDLKHGEETDPTRTHIKITFEGTSPPEGVVRLNGHILKILP